jgi:hypothetical protein
MNKGHISREELLAGIEKYKKHIYMPRWIEGAEQLSLDTEAEWPCNTAFCVGGLTCILNGDTLQDTTYGAEAVDENGKGWDVDERAANLLALPSKDLFFTKYWHHDLKTAFYDDPVPDGMSSQSYALSIIRRAIERYVPE